MIANVTLFQNAILQYPAGLNPCVSMYPLEASSYSTLVTLSLILVTLGVAVAVAGWAGSARLGTTQLGKFSAAAAGE